MNVLRRHKTNFINKRHVFSLFGFVILIFAFNPVSAQPGPVYVLTGRVVVLQADSSTIPLSNHSVTLYADYAYSYYTTTDQNGFFRFEAPPFHCSIHPDGEYTLFDAIPDHSPPYVLHYADAKAKICAATFGGRPLPPPHNFGDIVLLRNAIIGAVTDAAGDPVPNVTITVESSPSLMGKAKADGKSQNFVLTRTAQTNADGRYEFSELDPTLIHTVTPSSSSAIVFSPASQSVTDVSHNPNRIDTNFSSRRTIEIESYDKRFAPSVERLLFKYNVNTETTNYAYGKVEVFKNGDLNNPIYKDETIARTGTDVSYTQNGTPGWDGIMNQGADVGKYIEPKDGPFIIRLSMANQADYSDASKDEKTVKVEIESISLTPSGSFKAVKPSRTATEINKPIEALIKVKNKDGDGVVTAIPFKIKWSFEDPDDTASSSIIDPNDDSGDDNIDVSKGGKRTNGTSPGGIMWRVASGYTSTVATDGQTAETTAVTSGANQGKAKITFSSSAIGGDNYYLIARYQKDDSSLVAEKKSGKWSVWKKLNFNNVYRMNGGADVDTIMSRANINPAFNGEGYTDYTLGNITRLPTGSQSPEFVANLLLPDPSELPSAGDTQAQINTKAQTWFNRNRSHINTSHLNYISSINAPIYSVVGARYYHPKYDGSTTTGATNYYPAGTIITTDAGVQVDPDDDWSLGVQGSEISKVAFIYLNVSNFERYIIVGRHEVGHASDHVQFGLTDDHATSGLMHPTADISPANPNGVGTFSADSILRLRGVRR